MTFCFTGRKGKEKLNSANSYNQFACSGGGVSDRVVIDIYLKTWGVI